MITSPDDPQAHRAPDNRDPRRLIVFAAVVLLMTVALAWFLYTVRSMLVTIYISALLAMGISPLVRMIERQRLVAIGRVPRWLAILVIYAGIVLLLIGMGMAIFPPLIQQAEALYQTLPDTLDRAQQWLLDRGIIQEPITFIDAVRQAPAAGAGGAAATVFSAVRNVVGGIFGFITILLLTFYMLVDARAIFSFFVRLFPERERPRVAEVSRTVAQKVSAWLGGQAVLSAVIGLSTALGLWLMGVPYFYVLALISAIGELIPIVGPILAAIPAIIVAATVSPGLAIGVTVFFIAQQQIENNVLVPKLMGRQVGLTAVTVIIALGMGSQLLGVVGAILAIPTAAIVQVLFQELVRPEPSIAQTGPARS